MGKVYKLNSEKSLAHQVLEYAGWYEGRKVDVEKIKGLYGDDVVVVSPDIGGVKRVIKRNAGR